ncbi:MAG: pacearchaeosortase [Candidatus Nanoarchaeia archaeon]
MVSKTKKEVKRFLGMFFRYFILIITAFPRFEIFFIVFTPLTIYPVFFLLSFFYSATLSGIVITVKDLITIEMIRACIAGSAYYLLFVLNMSIPNIRLRKRVSMILFAFVLFLIANILRIFFLSIMAISGSSYFDITHKFFWYFLSTVFVVGVWFIEVKIFNIKEIPFYSDIKYLYKKSTLSHVKRKKK